MRRFNWKLAAVVCGASLAASGLLGGFALRDTETRSLTTAFWVVNSPGAAIAYLLASATGFFPGPGEDGVSVLDALIIGSICTASSVVWGIVVGFAFRRNLACMSKSTNQAEPPAAV